MMLPVPDTQQTYLKMLKKLISSQQVAQYIINASDCPRHQLNCELWERPSSLLFFQKVSQILLHQRQEVKSKTTELQGTVLPENSPTPYSVHLTLQMVLSSKCGLSPLRRSLRTAGHSSGSGGGALSCDWLGAKEESSLLSKQ